MYKKIFFIGFISVLIDQITKIIIDINLNYDELIEVIPKFFYLTRISNTGAAFSILEGKTIFFLLVSIATIIILTKYIHSFKNNIINNLAFGLIMGGIIGNFYDRLILGYVRDFIKINIFSYNFPIFNIADSSIVIGVIFITYSILRGDGSENSSRRK